MSDRAPLLSCESAERSGLLLANLNSFVLDYTARSAVGGTDLSFFIIKQLPVLPPSAYPENSLLASGYGRTLLAEVLELSYTAWDLEPFAHDCGYDGPPFKWNEERRFQIRAELDAAFFHLYLGTPEEWTRTGSPELLTSFPTPRHAVDYIMETFPIVKRKDEKAHGTYRTKLAILDIYDQMAEAIRTGQPYQTALTPPPGPPTDAEGNFIPMAQWNPANWPVHIHPPKKAPVEVEVPAAVEEVAVPGMDFDFNEQLIPMGGVETFVWAVLPRLLTLESPLSFGIARDAALLASDPLAMKLLLDEADAAAVDRILPEANKIDFSRDKHRVRFAEMTDALIASEALTTRGTTYAAGEAIRDHLNDHHVPAFADRLLPLALKAARRLHEVREVYAREHRFAKPQHQQARERIDARMDAIA